MIGIIRARLDTAPNAPVWSDQQWQRLMDPTVPYSLAHYWRTCSFGLADLNYRLIPAVTITDPKPTMTAQQLNADPLGRDTRAKAITKVVDDQFKPAWGAFTTLLIWVASPFDLWGSSAVDHGFGQCGVLVCDIASKFHHLCHELGHTIGFGHPYGLHGEYDSSYDIMGDWHYLSEWTRPIITGLPVGTASNGSDPQRQVGPMLSAAQLSASGYRPRLPSLFTELPANVQISPAEVRLQALDVAAANWPQPSGPVAAIMPPDPLSPSYHYIIELRRSNRYDAGLRSAALPSHPPPGIVVHGYDSTLNRMFFAGALALPNSVGDQDLHVFSGLAGSDFTLRLLEVGPDDEWARIRVGGPNYWRNFGVDVAITAHDSRPEYTAWQEVEVRPCVFAPSGAHSYRYQRIDRTHSVDAQSFGYELPAYVWTVGGATLNEPGGTVTLNIPTSVPDPIQVRRHEDQPVTFHYTLAGAHLELSVPGGDPAARGNFSVGLGVTATESSPEVLKNHYPDRSVTTVLRYDTVTIEWDESYKAKLDHCEQVMREVERKRIPVPIPGRPGEQPDHNLPSVLDVVASVIDVNPALANALIEEVSRSANIPNLEILVRLQARS